jgi:REP element-mobilizing transposase RayT
MPRLPRLDAPGAVHHVMLRGIERREIFVDDADRRDLLARMVKLVAELGFVCFAWAFMHNHLHFVLKTGPVPLSTLISRAATGYATRFNRRHDRVGHLFQNRFRSDLVKDSGHLRMLVRYVHSNPLRAGVVPSLDELCVYPWTGHAELAGTSPVSLVDREEVLSWFDGKEGLGRWMKESSGANRATLDFDELLDWVCAQLGLAPVDVRRGRRRQPEIAARAIVAHLASEELNLLACDVAEALGVDSGTATRLIRRGGPAARRAGLSFSGS